MSGDADRGRGGFLQRWRGRGADEPETKPAAAPAARPLAPNEIAELLLAGRKNEAVRRYQEATGQGAVAATQAVETVARQMVAAVAPTVPAAGDLQAEIIALLRAGKRFDAVRRYRDATKGSMSQAEMVVAAIEKQVAAKPAAPVAATAVASATDGSDWHKQVLAQLRAGDKNGAIKTYMRGAGVGLRQAEMTVEALARQVRSG